MNRKLPMPQHFRGDEFARGGPGHRVQLVRVVRPFEARPLVVQVPGVGFLVDPGGQGIALIVENLQL